MHRSVLLGFLILALPACGDDGGGTGETSSGSTSDASSTTEDPTADPTTDATSTGTTDPGSSSTTEPGTTTDATADASSSGSGDDSSSSGGGEFTVTSPSFAEGELFPFDMHICEGNVHPQLDWVNPPAGTMSFAVYFHDVTFDFEHSVIWDIPADATGVPSGIEPVAMPPSVAGASQCENWAMELGYGGPGSCDNTYQFTVYALDVATLEEVTTDSDRFAVRTALDAHVIETATLSGQTRGSTCVPMCQPMEE